MRISRGLLLRANLFIISEKLQHGNTFFSVKCLSLLDDVRPEKASTTISRIQIRSWVCRCQGNICSQAVPWVGWEKIRWLVRRYLWWHLCAHEDRRLWCAAVYSSPSVARGEGGAASPPCVLSRTTTRPLEKLNHRRPGASDWIRFRRLSLS